MVDNLFKTFFVMSLLVYRVELKRVQGKNQKLFSKLSMFFLTRQAIFKKRGVVLLGKGSFRVIACRAV